MPQQDIAVQSRAWTRLGYNLKLENDVDPSFGEERGGLCHTNSKIPVIISIVSFSCNWPGSVVEGWSLHARVSHDQSTNIWWDWVTFSRRLSHSPAMSLVDLSMNPPSPIQSIFSSEQYVPSVISSRKKARSTVLVLRRSQISMHHQASRRVSHLYPICRGFRVFVPDGVDVVMSDHEKIEMSLEFDWNHGNLIIFGIGN